MHTEQTGKGQNYYKLNVLTWWLREELGEQSGFRAGRSSLHNLLIFILLNEEKNSTNTEVHLLFVDLTKSYDTVPIKYYGNCQKYLQPTAIVVVVVAHDKEDLEFMTSL